MKRDKDANGTPGQAFVNVPASVFGMVRDRIAASSEDEAVASDALQTIGYGWAYESAAALGVKAEASTLKVALQQYCVQMGACKVKVAMAGEKVLEVSVVEDAVGQSDLVRGFVTGAVSAMMGESYISETVEEEPLTLRLTPKYLDFARPGGSEDANSRWTKLDFSEAYLLHDSSQADKALRLVADAAGHGVPVLVVTRVFPPKVRFRHPGLASSRIAWLTDTSSKSGAEDYDLFSPKRPDFEMARAMTDFFRTHKRGIVLLHGVEYLVSQTSFGKVEAFLQRMKDMAVSSDCAMLCPVSPEALGTEQYAKLAAEYRTVK